MNYLALVATFILVCLKLEKVSFFQQIETDHIFDFTDWRKKVMKIWVFLLLIICAGICVGCIDRTEERGGLESEVIELEKQQTTKIEVIAKEKQIEQPITVTLIHPHTLEMIQTILPEELGYKTNFEQYKKELKALAKQLARGTDTSDGYDQTMALDKVDVDGQIIKGNPMIVLKESELVDKIISISKTGGKVYLPIYIIDSTYDAEDVINLDDVLVASYTTHFNFSEIGRSMNIKLSANTLNNIIVGTGDYFSFNTMVGERTEERGYQPAPEIVNKQLVMGIGGGICQTSSTLFNAVDQTAIRIVERHHHSLDIIKYVPEGRDATVAYGTLDFKFQNTSEAPFLIKTIYSDGALTVEIRTAQSYEHMLKR